VKKWYQSLLDGDFDTEDEVPATAIPVPVRTAMAIARSCRSIATNYLEEASFLVSHELDEGAKIAHAKAETAQEIADIIQSMIDDGEFGKF